MTRKAKYTSEERQRVLAARRHHKKTTDANDKRVKTKEDIQRDWGMI